MLMIRKNDAGQEYIVLKNIEVLELYMNFLGQRRAASLMGDGLSESAIGLIDLVLSAGERGGKKINGPLFSIGQSQVELEMEKAGKGRFIDRDALDELVAAKAVVCRGESTESKYDSHARSVIVYNAETLKRIRLLGVYLSVFKEEVKF